MELSVGELGPRPAAPASDRATPPRVILVRETSHFRRLAETVPKTLTKTPADTLTDADGHAPRLVLDIGSAYGHATEILATALEDPSRVIGIDVGRHFIEVCWARVAHSAH